MSKIRRVKLREYIMVFSNLLFVFVFLPLNLIVYSLAKNIKLRNAVMIVFSLIFYCWGDPKYLILLIGMVLSNWIFSLLIEKHKGTKQAKFWLVCACVVSLGLLCVFKYTNFIVANISTLFNLPDLVTNIALPIGISFYTFQVLTYVIDVYKGEVEAQHSFWHLLLYVSLFHQCIAGPIVRYSDVSREITNRRVTAHEFSTGVTRFAVGLAKKALLANVCAKIADTILLSDAVASDASLLAENIAVIASKPASLLWLGVLMYMLQIYLDFSAYSDMAIGMGLMIGFHYKENFNYPYIANSVTDFWRRWHISLSSFFRDYVYIPLGGNRKGLARKLVNMLVVWFLTGLWHGASWNFVLWGLYFFIFLVIENIGLRKILEKIPVLGNIYLLVVVFFGWILFRFSDLSLMWTVIKGLFCANGNPFIDFEANTMWLNYIFFIIVAIISCTPIAKKTGGFLRAKGETSKAVAVGFGTVEVIIPLALLLLSAMALVGNSYNPFIYFRF